MTMRPTLLQVSTSEADRIIHAQVPNLDADRDTEFVSLDDALDRILSRPIVAPLDFPHWDNSAMDGYALRYEDALLDEPLTLLETIPAGHDPQLTLQAGHAARILTGAMLPQGADTIVMQENAQREDNQVFILKPPQARGEFVRHQGSYARSGQILLDCGLHLGPAELAVLAAAQCVSIPVWRKLKIALLSTGGELVSPDQQLRPGQIVDSNYYALRALIQQAGAELVSTPSRLDRAPIIPDDPATLQTAMQHAITTADLVISTGGVSVGDYDYIDQTLKTLAATLHIQAVAIKPGKPLTFATIARSDNQTPCLYFGLPGNPVSALVTFWRFVRPALLKFSGLSQNYAPTFIPAITTQPLTPDRYRELYLWGTLTHTSDHLEFTPVSGSHSSGNLINLAGTQALARLPIGSAPISSGSSIDLLLMR